MAEAELRPDSVALLMAEHEQAIEMYKHSEELGERRVNFFLTLMTAAFAALALGDDPIVEDGRVDGVTWVLLISVLLFGLVTLARVAQRNLRSTAQLQAANRVRSYFLERDPELARYLAFKRDPRPREKPWNQLFSIRGGLADTMMLVNSLLVAALVSLAVATAEPPWYSIALAGVLAALAAWVAQYAGVRAVYERGRRKSEADQVQG